MIQQCLLLRDRLWYASATDYAGTCIFEQLVRYFPQVQFLDKVVDCPLLCSLGYGPDSAARAVLDKVDRLARYCASSGDGPDSAQFVQFLDKVVDMPVAVR